MENQLNRVCEPRLYAKDVLHENFICNESFQIKFQSEKRVIQLSYYDEIPFVEESNPCIFFIHNHVDFCFVTPCNTTIMELDKVQVFLSCCKVWENFWFYVTVNNKPLHLIY